MDELDAILDKVGDVEAVAATLPAKRNLLEELRETESIDKLVDIIRELLLREAAASGKRLYPKQLLRQQHIIAYLLLNPFATTMEVCRFFQVSPTVLYNISKSDTFKALACQYRVKIDNNPDIQQQLKDTMAAAIEITQEALAKGADAEFALQVMDKTANRLGMGAKQGTNVQINNNILTPEMLAVARQRRLGNAPT